MWFKLKVSAAAIGLFLTTERTERTERTEHTEHTEKLRKEEHWHLDSLVYGFNWGFGHKLSVAGLDKNPVTRRLFLVFLAALALTRLLLRYNFPKS